MKNSNSIKNREDTLKEASNSFQQNTLNSTEDFYSELSITDLIKLKLALSDINNIITLRLTLAAAKFLYANGIINEKQKEELIKAINKVSPNANGYDIEIQEDGNYPPVIAEVKANVPCVGIKTQINGITVGARYGANQKKRLLEDIDSLLNGKSKATIQPNSNPAPLKFIFVLDFGTGAIEDFIKSLPQEYTGKVALYDPNYKLNDLDPNKVYIVPITIELLIYLQTYCLAGTYFFRANRDIGQESACPYLPVVFH